MQRDKQKKDKQKTLHFFVYSRRATHDPHYVLGMVIEEVRAIFAPHLFDSISSFAARGYWIFVEKCPHRGKLLKTWLFVPRKQPN